MTPNIHKEKGAASVEISLRMVGAFIEIEALTAAGYNVLSVTVTATGNITAIQVSYDQRIEEKVFSGEAHRHVDNGSASLYWPCNKMLIFCVAPVTPPSTPTRH